MVPSRLNNPQVLTWTSQHFRLLEHLKEDCCFFLHLLVMKIHFYSNSRLILWNLPFTLTHWDMESFFKSSKCEAGHHRLHWFIHHILQVVDWIIICKIWRPGQTWTWFEVGWWCSHTRRHFLPLTWVSVDTLTSLAMKIPKSHATVHFHHIQFEELIMVKK